MKKSYLTFAVLVVVIYGTSNMIRQRKNADLAVSGTSKVSAVSAESVPSKPFTAPIGTASSQEEKLKNLGVVTAASSSDLILAEASSTPELRAAYKEFKTVRLRLKKDVQQLNALNEALTRLGESSPELNRTYHRYQQEVLKNYKTYMQAGAELRQHIVADMNRK